MDIRDIVNFINRIVDALGVELEPKRRPSGSTRSAGTGGVPAAVAAQAAR